MSSEKDLSVKDLYDIGADGYHENRGLFPIKHVLEHFRYKLNRIEGNLLDLGCGTGVPVCKHFFDYGWSVTGVDISDEMLKIARQLNPGIVFHQGSMTTFEMGKLKYDAVTAIYSIFHLELEEQSEVFKKVYAALKKGGMFLFTYASKEYTKHDEFAGEIKFNGTPLPYHHTTKEKLKKELVSLEFSITDDMLLNIGGENFIWMIAEK